MKISKYNHKLIDCLIILAIAVVMYLLKIPCLFKSVFGIECPGCGITRAYISILSLDIKKAFEFNPMFWSVPIVSLIYLFENKLNKYRRLTGITLGLIFLGFFILWMTRIIL